MNSKNRRKFRVWDNNLLFEVYQQTSQITSTIESKCNPETSPDMLPPSMVPTDILYNIASCFDAMYIKLLEEQLLTAGYPRMSKTAH